MHYFEVCQVDDLRIHRLRTTSNTDEHTTSDSVPTIRIGKQRILTHWRTENPLAR